MSIEDVIARSRQPGAFVERKRFAVERANAIRKMRQFALADPHYYVLELIQSSVANGASSINLVARENMCLFSYVGGGYTEDELIKLFDFLFAAKSDMAYSALRQLALGVNALMLMNPEEITIESGDGTVEGTTRVVIQPGKDVVDVGTPDHGLDGTFVRASGLKRKLIRDRSNLQPTDYGPAETRAIEERCLTLPIPIIVNDRSVFGFSSVRTPTLFGYDKVIAIDEGDLYGSIGLALPQSPTPSFKLLTYGTWVQTVDHALLPGEAFGGIISYDRLNKTADHAAIVQDLRYEELWARLQPYARRLRYGASEAAKYEVTTLTGRPLSAREVVELLGKHDFAVLVPVELTAGSEQEQRARRIAHNLAENTPILRVHGDDAPRIKYLSRKARVLTPDLDTDRDEVFLQKPQMAPPASPWLIQPVEAHAITLAELILDIWDDLHPEEAISRAASTVFAEKLNGRWVNLRTGSDGEPDLSTLYNVIEGVEDGARHALNKHAAVVGAIRATIYAPSHAFCEANQTLVRLVSSGRLLWAGKLPTMFPGFVISVEFDGVMPRHLDVLPFDESETSFPVLIAQATLRFLHQDLEVATQRVFDNLRNEDISPDTTAAQLCLGLLAREGHMRIVTSEDGTTPRFELMMMRPSTLDVLHVPLFKDMQGTPRTLAEVFEHMSTQGGLIYGVVDPALANLEGLAKERLLDLTLAQEALLMAIVGAPAYVRVDGRDTLAMLTSPTLVQVRDMVLGEAIADAGMRALEAKDLILTQDASLDETTTQTLLKQLLELVRSEPSPDLNEEDLRRQALRHVQRFVIRRAFRQQPTYGIERVPLLIDLYGRSYSVEQLQAMCHEQSGRILMGDGRAMDLLIRPSSALQAPLAGLAMNPFLAVILSEFVQVTAAFDFSLELEINEEDLSRANLSSEHFLIGHDVLDETLGLDGRIGIPLEQPRTSTSLLLREEESGRCLALPSLTQDLGIVGVLQVDRLDALDAKACEALLYRHASSMLEQLVEQMPERDTQPDRWRRSVETLLAYAEQHLMLAKTSQGVRCQVYHGLSQRILSMPLFDTTGRQPVSAMSLFKSFCMHIDGYTQVTDLRTQLDPNLDTVLRDWIARNLSVERIVRHDTDISGHRAAIHQEASDTPVTRIEALLSGWIQALRPDDYKPMYVIAVRRDQESDFARVEQFMGPARSWFFTPEKKRDQAPLLFMDWGDSGLICVDLCHWLFANLSVQSAHDQEPLAWALLAIYAHLNAMLEPVTNTHERDFHVRIMDALTTGRLATNPINQP